MCGIAGLIGPYEEAALDRMLEGMRHRGPNDSGIYRDAAEHVAIGMRRLSILDLAEGHQPMCNEDGMVWIVFNGEIYNAPSLRPPLVEAGHIFRTDHSDTEVLLHLYEEHGTAMLEKVDGMFAFVIYDRRNKTLFGARDRLGEKPFYYRLNQGRLAFASELKCLLTLPDATRELNRSGFYHYLSLLYLPDENSIFSGIQRLPAAHFFTFDLASHAWKTQPYWRPIFGEEERRDEGELRRLIRDGLREGVRSRLLSDVPVGVSLSGGIDSAAIVGLMAESGVSNIKTYSLGFHGADEQQWNELPLAREVAQRWGTEHHEQILEPQALLDDLLQMVWHLDEPYGGGLPAWYVFRFMSESVTVGLTGTGGDELFGNYGKFSGFESPRHVPAVLGLRRRLGAGNATADLAMRGLAGLGQMLPLGSSRRERMADLPRWYRRPVGPAYLDTRYYFSEQQKRTRVLRPEVFGDANTEAVLQEIYDAAGSTEPRNAIAYLDLKTQLPEEFLSMTDRFSMAHSLEARVPFLDPRFVELVLGIGPSVRTSRRDLKYLLKAAVSDLLPASLLQAKKRGFVLPIEIWLRRELRPLCERLLNPERLRKQGYFHPDFYTHYVEPHLEGRATHTVQIWAALMFQLWHMLFVEEKATSAPTCSWKDLL